MTVKAASMVSLTLCLMATFGTVFALEEREARELSCQPVHGYIQLPGIKYDDLTPLARDVFRANPAAVSNALYALPMAEREDFITLYLEPNARERHRYFFARCRETAERRAMAAMIDGGDVIPPALRQELQEREKVRLALYEGAVPFRIGNTTIRIPVPDGYRLDDGPLAMYLRDRGVIESLAVFGKTVVLEDAGEETATTRPLLASISAVREGSDTAKTMLQAYRTMVDADWRLAGLYPPGATLEQAETIEYKWNLPPFNIRDHSFCYGQFEKRTDIHGVNYVHYRATAVITLPGCYIQVSVLRPANTSLAQVDEINTDITRWRDAIVNANWQLINP